MTEYINEYKVGIIVSLENCTSSTKGGKALKVCRINIGDPDHHITVVTAAPNVREGSRVAVAVVGSKVMNDSGDEIIITKTSVGGHMSEGMLCDSKMLGWIGGSEGIAQQIPDSIDIGSSPPSSKPKVTFDSSTTDKSTADIIAVDVKPLFEKKLTKEEKKKLADEKRKAKKAAKETATTTTETSTTKSSKEDEEDD